MNEIFTKDANGKSICVPSNDSSTVLFSPLFSDFNESGVLVPGKEEEKFVAVVGIPCRYRKYVSRDRARDLCGIAIATVASPEKRVTNYLSAVARYIKYTEP